MLEFSFFTEGHGGGTCFVEHYGVVVLGTSVAFGVVVGDGGKIEISIAHSC